MEERYKQNLSIYIQLRDFFIIIKLVIEKFLFYIYIEPFGYKRALSFKSKDLRTIGYPDHKHLLLGKSKEDLSFFNLYAQTSACCTGSYLGFFS